jgi:hypothetical protein
MRPELSPLKASVKIVFVPISRAVNTSIQISPTPPSRLFVDKIRQTDSKTPRVESRIHAYPPYDVGTDKKTVVAILSLEQVVDVRPVSATAREE